MNDTEREKRLKLIENRNKPSSSIHVTAEDVDWLCAELRSITLPVPAEAQRAAEEAWHSSEMSSGFTSHDVFTSGYLAGYINTASNLRELAQMVIEWDSEEIANGDMIKDMKLYSSIMAKARELLEAK